MLPKFVVDPALQWGAEINLLDAQKIRIPDDSSDTDDLATPEAVTSNSIDLLSPIPEMVSGTADSRVADSHSAAWVPGDLKICTSISTTWTQTMA